MSPDPDIRKRWKKELSRPGKVAKRKVELFKQDVKNFLLRNPLWLESTKPE